MRISNKWAQAQINVKEWWPAKGVTPQILEVWKMVIIWEGTSNTITSVLSNNFEFHSSETLICRCPR